MAIQFKKATKKQARLRMAVIGPSGAGKTYSSLAVGEHLGEKTAVIDTEHGSASKFADKFKFDVLELESYAPKTYIEAIKAAEDAGYDVLIIDSLSHAWMGRDGALEQVDKAAKRSQSGNSFAAWRDVTPQHNALIEAMLQCRCHLIVTMRAKTEYVLEKDERSGKTTPKKIGLAPVQRDGMEYEFDVTGDITLEHNLIISKTRCDALDGQVINKPGKQVADILKAWLSDGAEPAPEKKSEPAPEKPTLATDPAYEQARKEIIADLREVFLSQGKTEAEWDTYQLKLRGKSADDLETMLADWKKKAATKTQAASAQPEPAKEVETVNV